MPNNKSTSEVKSHYESLLAEHYSWMCGSFKERVSQTTGFFQKYDLQHAGETALDLGCGSGIQACALARMGFNVTAIDFNTQLLNELEANSKGLAITTIEADLTELSRKPILCDQFDVVVCMGDTLTHLPSRNEVESLIEFIASDLIHPHGMFVLSFRDLSTELCGIERAIPVRLDDDKLMLTFLEYHLDKVLVHDMIFSKEENNWTLQKSAYPKLRLSLDDIKLLLLQYEFEIVHHETERGFCQIISQKK